MPSPHHILVINAGSSSIKFALYQIGHSLRRLHSGSLDRIGQAEARLQVLGPNAGDQHSSLVVARDQPQAIAIVIDWIDAHSSAQTLAAIGHRLVHGGPSYSAPQWLNAAVIADLQQLLPLDPAHLPTSMALIEALRQHFPEVPQVACFDTAFHQAMPRVAQLLAIPRRYQALGLRRFGFHGLSYEFLLGELGRLAGTEAAQGRVILAHLGNGASVAAVHNGQSIDTSMGFTPASGLPMGTRAGDIDPGLAWYLARTEQMTPAQFNQMVTEQSGLLGVSGTSADVRDLLVIESQLPAAADAIELFCYQVKKWIGAMAAALGGVDTLVFAGGIGESAPSIRARICEGLEFLGIVLDPQRNADAATLISADGLVQVRVIATDEALMIARTVAQLLDPAA